MSLYVLFLVLSAAILHASWNLLAKKTGGKTPFIWLQYMAGNILYLPYLLVPGSPGYLKYSYPLFLFSFGSAILHVGYFTILQKGYRVADLSVVYPLARGSAPLISFIAAIVLLQEPLKLSSVTGLFFIIAGVLVITGLNFKNNDKVINGINYGLLTGVFIALYTFNDAVAIKTYALSPLMLTIVTNIFSTVLLFPFVISQKDELKREIRTHKRIIVAIAILSPAAYILVLEALRYAPLSVVAPARETSILLGVFMGSRVFNEEDNKRRLVAAVLIFAGIIALSLG